MGVLNQPASQTLVHNVMANDNKQKHNWLTSTDKAPARSCDCSMFCIKNPNSWIVRFHLRQLKNELLKPLWHKNISERLCS